MLVHRLISLCNSSIEISKAAIRSAQMDMSQTVFNKQYILHVFLQLLIYSPSHVRPLDASLPVAQAQVGLVALGIAKHSCWHPPLLEKHGLLPVFQKNQGKLQNLEKSILQLISNTTTYIILHKCFRIPLNKHTSKFMCPGFDETH